MHKTVLLACLAVVLASGCAGTGHQIPRITEAERANAIREILYAPSLSPTSRTASENERIAREVFRSLQSASTPVCKRLGRDKCWYSLEFRRDSSVNAAILKNRMVFTNGLASYLETEDEFAAVIGHEMGHYLAFHYEEDAQNRAVGSVIAALIFGGLAAATGAYENNPYGFRTGLNSFAKTGAAIGQLSFSKEQEREADYLGAYLMTRAGYNPEKGNKVWIKMAKMSGRTRTKLLDTHPAGPDRLAAWYKTIEEVRFSADLMPNPVDGGDEPKLQVARVFGPDVMDDPTPQLAAVKPEPEDPEPEAPEPAPALAAAAVPSGPAPAAPAAKALVAAPAAAAPAADVTYAASVTWSGLGEGLTGKLFMTEDQQDRGDLELRLEERDGAAATRCGGTWTQQRHGEALVIGHLSIACDNGRKAEGRYRLDDGPEGLAGLEDSEGNFVELKLRRI